MINILSEELITLATSFMFPLARILAFLATEPILGNRSIPKRVKIGLGVALSIMITPLIQNQAVPPVDMSSVLGVLSITQEILIGITLGLTVKMIFLSIELGGNIIGNQMGLGFANFFDPINSSQVPVISQFIGMISMLLYLSIDGHLMMIQALTESFKIIPIGINQIHLATFKNFPFWGSEIFRLGLKLALPVIAVILMTNMGMAVLARSAPQLNIFVVGFAIFLLIGFALVHVMMPYFIPLIQNAFEHGVGQGLTLLRSTK